MNPHAGIGASVEILRPAQYVGGDFVFARGAAWILDGMFAEVEKDPAEGFAAFEKFVVDDLLNLRGESGHKFDTWFKSRHLYIQLGMN